MKQLNGISRDTDILYGKRPTPTYSVPDNKSEGFQECLDAAVERIKHGKTSNNYQGLHTLWERECYKQNSIREHDRLLGSEEPRLDITEQHEVR